MNQIQPCRQCGTGLCEQPARASQPAQFISDQNVISVMQLVMIRSLWNRFDHVRLKIKLLVRVQTGDSKRVDFFAGLRCRSDVVRSSGVESERCRANVKKEDIK